MPARFAPFLNQELYTLNVQHSTNGTSFSTGGIGLIQGTRRTGAYNNTANGAGTEHNTFAPRAAFFSFCVELTEGISLSTTYQITWSQVSSAPTSAGGMNAQRANLLAELFYRNVPVLNQMMGQTTTACASLLARATQLAIWEIVHQGTTTNTISLSSLNVTSGNIYSLKAFSNPSAQVLADTNATILKANTMLSGLTGSTAGI